MTVRKRGKKGRKGKAVKMREKIVQKLKWNTRKNKTDQWLRTEQQEKKVFCKMRRVRRMKRKEDKRKKKRLR